jgi:hypothetical protein
MRPVPLRPQMPPGELLASLKHLLHLHLRQILPSRLPTRAGLLPSEPARATSEEEPPQLRHPANELQQPRRSLFF